MRRWGQPWQPWTDDDARTYAVTLGGNLRERRAVLGLTLEAVETRTGGRVKAETLGTWERADAAIKPERLSELAGAYDIHVGELLPEDTWTLGRDA